ncbi:hypothetical protein RGUI_2629 [Rhodovulum sp. P5]|uniref:ABC transporter substrate-binding protein n=1 Tax=Rhodovulum sp. P5 TaxID=1564506 RepID=UPI0009C2236F|nr:ABC transporter substrate-binding protein [Rhodovulum sp. P5]ARE40770.1 hypothetical protein RGUI_2629 [Rhodovulum sp. P5]
MLRVVLAVMAVAAMLGGLPARAELSVAVGYLRVDVPLPPTLSNLDPVPDDLGIAGAEVGLADNATTGRFLGHGYGLRVVRVPVDGDVAGAARALLGETRLVLVDAPADTLLEIADLPEARSALLFNVAARDNRLRDGACRGNLLHTIPSDAMRTDALAQFLVRKRWTDVALIEGTTPADVQFADALRRSMTKFGLKLRGQNTWAFDADMRRNAAQEVPVFTQAFKEYDVLLVADAADDFARYIPFNTWEPRPVAGSAGLRPMAWSRVVEQWGAAQLQSRFADHAGRDMQPKDYAAWAALRSIGEAVTRTGVGDAATLRAFLLSDAFELGGFKGRPLSYRGWNGQLRQPIALVGPRALVATAPMEGFLHARNELDTLGLDRPESACTAFGG